MKDFEPYEGKEDDLQAACMRWLRLEHPNVLAFHVPNGGKRNAREAAKFKRLGVLAGVPDVLIVHPSNFFNGFAVELKVKGGKASPRQKERLSDFHLAGWKQKIIYSFDEFEQEVNSYLNQHHARP